MYLKPPNPPTLEATDELRDRVSGMLRDMEVGGMDAVRRWSAELDDWSPDSFVVTDADFARAEAELGDDLKAHIAFAQDQVRGFAQVQRDSLTDVRVEMGPGVILGHRHIPVQTVGAYVPGGRYPMLASSFMTVLVAKVAGVETVVACAPPQRGGGIHPAMLYAMRTSGADVIVCLGGVQALAAMAFGLIEGVPPIDMLVGAGNAFVAEAKRQLYGRVGIDLLAGPTEILVIADGSADPRLVAADLLGQAEHGPTSPAGLIAIGEDVARAVMAEVDDLLGTWPTADVAGVAWRDQGWVAVAADDDEAIRLSDDAAYEHLEVQVEDAKLDMYRERLRNYGSLFLGARATVAYGDKAIGTNHVLPTLRGARFTGGLWVGKFLKTCT
jgi:sulfopropanediol 3-dehydrogenase